MLIDRSSLSRTVDAINDAMFHTRSLGASERTEAARWIAGRHGLPGAYADTFAGFPNERDKGIVLFTGERINSASARHILGEEACRVLRLLRVQDKAVTAALGGATDGLLRCLDRAAQDPRHTNPGVYCCGKCTVGLWRHLLAGGLDRQEERLQRGVAGLRSLRDGDGQWRKYPFWYTVLALSELDGREALGELRYAAPVLKRAVGPPRGASTPYAARRRELAGRALAKL